jgi:hypothetical protein
LSFYPGNTPPSATSPSPLSGKGAAWRERIAAPFIEDCPISGASRSPATYAVAARGVRGPRFPSTRARAVGPSEPAFAVSAGGASPVLLLASGNPWRLIAPATKRMYLRRANRRGRQLGQTPIRPAAAFALDQLSLGATSSQIEKNRDFGFDKSKLTR